MGGGDDKEGSGGTETKRSGVCADGAEANGVGVIGAKCWKEERSLGMTAGRCWKEVEKDLETTWKEVKMDLGTRMGGETLATTKMATEVRNTTT